MAAEYKARDPGIGAKKVNSKGRNTRSEGTGPQPGRAVSAGYGLRKIAKALVYPCR